MLDASHRTALRAVAAGTATGEHAPAIRDLSVAGLVAPVDGVWSLTQTGHAVLELEGQAASASGGGAGTDTMTDLKAKIRDWFMT